MLTIERFAELVAYLSEYPAEDHPTVLERLDVSLDESATAHAHWPRELAQRLEQADTSLVLAFAPTLIRIRKDIRLWRWPAGQIKPDVSLRGVGPLAAPPGKTKRPLSPKEAAPPRDTNPAVPSYLREPEPTLRDSSVQTPPPAPPPVQAPVGVSFAIGAPAAPTPAPKGLAATGFIDPDRMQQALMPFKPGAAPTPAAAPPPPPPGEPKPTLSTGTVMSSGPLVDPRSTPFAPAAEGSWKLEQFVELTVALARADDRIVALARFGLTLDTHRALAAEWGARITNDTALRQRFDELVKARRAQGG